MAPLHSTLDPSQNAGATLRRLGFAVLLLVIPIVPFVARRGIAVLVPIGIGVLVLAALVDGNRRRLGDSLGSVLAAPALPGVVAILVWCGLSLAWTPFLDFATDRYTSILVMLVLGVAGCAAFPERMRAANLYLLPIGVLLGAAAAMALMLLGSAAGRAAEEDGQSLARGLVVLALMLWPAIAWLHSRQRPWDGLMLGIFVALAAVFGPRAMPVLALSFGAVAFGLAVRWGRRGARIAGAAMAGLVMAAPALPFLLAPLASWAPLAGSLAVWRRIVVAEPIRLITGHGFETLVRSRLSGALPLEAPTSLLFEIWYELGLVGAACAAWAIYAATGSASQRHPVLLPGATGALGTAFAFACLGVGTAQIWWFAALVVLVLAFVACDRGQFRTTRPKASILTGARRA